MDKHIGEQYGHFEIVSRDTSKKREYYFLKCLNCGKIQEKSVRYDGIKNNSKGRKCDCDKDLSGQTFGFLKVLSLDSERSKEKKDSYYFCECQRCNRNKVVSVRGAHLKDGNTKSCGCLNDESHRKDLRGQIFGTFKIIDVDYQKTYDINRSGTGTYWKAICINCGKERPLNARDLLQNKIPYCECDNPFESKGEKMLDKLLQSLNIIYEKQKSFKDFITKDFGVPRFDFYFDNIAIEYNGIQHYEPIEHFGGEQAFEHRQYLDNLKRQYCKEHNIKLIEIPYWDYNKLNEDYLLLKINS